MVAAVVVWSSIGRDRVSDVSILTTSQKGGAGAAPPTELEIEGFGGRWMKRWKDSVMVRGGDLSGLCCCCSG